MAARSDPLLAIEDLTVAYRVEGELQPAVRNISFSIEQGQTYGLVGESGSGKSTIALAVMRYLPEGAQVLQGRIRLHGEDLLELPRREMRRIWGAELALVPQDPLSSLNPALKIGEQLSEIQRHHMGLKGRAAWDRSVELLGTVQIADADRVADSYPHQISGGMQQRVMIAMALSTEPSLLVLDEPTTSVDATTQAAMLDLIRELMQEHDAAALYVTHNLGVVAQICERVAVLYAGELVEDGPTESLYKDPLFPYTRGLLDSVPRLGESKREVQLRPIQGRIPSLGERPSGCVFRDRCPLAIEVCETYPPLFEPGPNRRTRCHRWEEIDRGEVQALQPAAGAPEAARQEWDRTVLDAVDVRVHFDQDQSLFNAITGEELPPVKAVDGVDLALQEGQTVGLVGESGSGKTTIARAILGLVPRTDGDIKLFGVSLPEDISARDLSSLRELQIVFQNPQEALNPYMTVGEALRYPLQHLRGLSRSEAEEEVGRLLEAVNLTPAYAKRMPRQLSGGEKQRVAVARAFAAQPALIVADEPVTSLDVSVQASLLNLLNQLQAQEGGSYLLISHDLAVVGYLSDIVAVIYLGKLMEVADAESLFEPPYHPYTEALLSAIPLIDPHAQQQQIRLEGEVPSPVDPPSGCPFHTRCPRFLGDICVDEDPPWRETDAGKRYYCHIPPEELKRDQQRAFRFSQGDES